MHLAEFLRTACWQLEKAGIDNPSLDARLLAGHALGLNRAELLSQSKRVLTGIEMSAIEDLLAQRALGKPVARVMGKREFWSLEFGLNEDTLEPRPDSETLIDAALKLSRNAKRILDLGTGTGCLLLSLLREFPDATGLGVDIAPGAVEQAKKNATVLGFAARVQFRVGNWLEGVSEKFDIVVCNPPYIPSEEISMLMREVSKFDPKIALDGGKDGLESYRSLIPQLAACLTPRGIIVLEVGQGQANHVVKILKKSGFDNIALHKDLGGIERCVTADQSAYR